jgi:hypothetical protein
LREQLDFTVNSQAVLIDGDNNNLCQLLNDLYVESFSADEDKDSFDVDDIGELI